MLRLPPLAAGLALLAVLAPLAFTDDAKPADWPQYLGTNRDNHSPDTGLLKQWPKDGPPLAWKSTGLGGGFSSSADAVRSPKPGRPGIPSASSPTSASQSGMLCGVIPRRRKRAHRLSRIMTVRRCR